MEVSSCVAWPGLLSVVDIGLLHTCPCYSCLVDGADVCGAQLLDFIKACAAVAGVEKEPVGRSCNSQNHELRPICHSVFSTKCAIGNMLSVGRCLPCNIYLFFTRLSYTYVIDNLC